MNVDLGHEVLGLGLCQSHGGFSGDLSEDRVILSCEIVRSTLGVMLGLQPLQWVM